MTNKLPDLGCGCATLRRAARLVTQLYSQEMSRTAEPGQYALLSAMQANPGLNQARLGAALGLDKTTMSRNLRVMKSYGWIRTTTTEDRRETGYHLTTVGKNTLAAAEAGWSSAQAKLRAHLKPGEWETLMAVLGRVSVAALAAQEPD